MVAWRACRYLEIALILELIGALAAEILDGDGAEGLERRFASAVCVSVSVFCMDEEKKGIEKSLDGRHSFFSMRLLTY